MNEEEKDVVIQFTGDEISKLKDRLSDLYDLAGEIQGEIEDIRDMLTEKYEEVLSS